VKSKIDRIRKFILEDLKSRGLSLLRWLMSYQAILFISVLAAWLAVFIALRALDVQIDSTRPYIRVVGIQGYSHMKDYFEFQLELGNEGVHPASDLSVIVYFVKAKLDSSNTSPFFETKCFSILGEFVGNAVQTLRVDNPIWPNLPFTYILFKFKYYDPITDRQYEQFTWTKLLNDPLRLHFVDLVEKPILDSLLKNLPPTCD